MSIFERLRIAGRLQLLPPTLRIAPYLIVLAIAVAGPLPAQARIPPPLPHNMQACYRVDRWGQHRLGYHFVLPELAPKLEPLVGGLIQMTVTERILDSDRQPWVITDFKNAAKRIVPYEVILSCLGPLESPTKAEAARLQGLVQDLGSSSYQVRRTAHDQLLKAGPAALPWMKVTQPNASLELVRRVRACAESIASKPDLAAPSVKPLRIEPRSKVQVKVTVINRSGKAQPSIPARLILTEATRYPFRPTGRHAYLPASPAKDRKRTKDGKQTLGDTLDDLNTTFLFYHENRKWLVPKSQTVSWEDEERMDDRESGFLPALMNGEAVVWSLVLDKVWDVEAELVGSLGFEMNRSVWAESNVLRLDVTGPERLHPQPLRVALHPAKDAGKRAGPIPVRISFTNVVKKPLEFWLPWRGNGMVTYDLLFAYDESGTLLRGKSPGWIGQYHVVRLKPGQTETFDAELPAATAHARFALDGALASGLRGVREDNNGGPHISLAHHGTVSPLVCIEK